MIQYFQDQNSNRVVLFHHHGYNSNCNTYRKYGRFILALGSQSMGEVKQGVNYQPKCTRQLTNFPFNQFQSFIRLSFIPCKP